MRWFDYFSHYQNGFLYRDGAIADQPAKYLDAMNILSRKKSEYRQQELEDTQES